MADGQARFILKGFESLGGGVAAAWVPAKLVKWMVGYFLSLALLYLICATVSYHFVHQKFLPEIEAGLAANARHLPNLLGDLRRLDRTLVFPDGPRRRNAESFLRDKIAWEGKGALSLPSKDHDDLVALMKDFAGKKFDKDYFQALTKDQRVQFVNVAWVDDLDQFDHWELWTYPAQESELAKSYQLDSLARLQILADLPVPKMGELLFAVQLRLFQWKEKGKPEKGLQLYRHAARLFDSTATLLGAMMAVRTLNEERVMGWALAPYTWEAVDETWVQAYKRASWGWSAVFDRALFFPFPEEFRPYLKKNDAVCATLRERAFGLGWRDLLSASWPLESGFSARIQGVDTVVKQGLKACGLEKYIGFVDLPRRPWPLYRMVGRQKLVNPAAIPFVRVPLGLMLMSMAGANPMRYYAD